MKTNIIQFSSRENYHRWRQPGAAPGCLVRGGKMPRCCAASPDKKSLSGGGGGGGTASHFVLPGRRKKLWQNFHNEGGAWLTSELTDKQKTIIEGDNCAPAPPYPRGAAHDDNTYCSVQWTVSTSFFDLLALYFLPMIGRDSTFLLYFLSLFWNLKTYIACTSGWARWLYKGIMSAYIRNALDW